VQRRGCKWPSIYTVVHVRMRTYLSIYRYILAPVAALPPPGFETLSMVDLLRYQVDHLDFCCVSTTVYLDLVLLYICHCVSAAAYLQLCICSCVSAIVSTVLYIHYCICCCSSTTVYPLQCICRCVSAAVYIVPCILNYFSISAAVNMYPDMVLYIWLYIYHCIYICHGVSATVSAVLYIRCCIRCCVPAAVYPTLLSAAVYPTLVSAAVYLPLCILCCGSAAVYLPLCSCHCVCCIVESDRVQRERLNYLLYKSDYLPNHLMVEAMPLYT